MSTNKANRPEHRSSSDPKQDGGDTQSTKRHVYVESGVQIDVVKSLKEQHDAERREDTSAQKKQLLWTRVAAILVLIYTGIMFWQGWLTREVITTTMQQFQRDQRPYVWPGNIQNVPLNIAPGQKLWTNIGWINYGKTPAMKFGGVATVFFGPNALKDADKWFAALGGVGLPQMGGTETIVPPGLPPDSKHTYGGFSTPFSERFMTQADVDYVLSHDESVAVVLRVQYFDTFGNRYWSDVCLSRFRNGNTPHCDHHNEIH